MQDTYASTIFALWLRSALYLPDRMTPPAARSTITPLRQADSGTEN